MKRVSNFLIILFFALSNLEAGSFNEYGILGAFNVSTFRSESISSSNMYFTYSIGIYSKYSINENFAIRPELFFAKKGALLSKSNQNINGEDYNVKNATDLFYLDLPVNFILNLSPNYEVFAGPFLSYFLGGKSYYSEKTVLYGRKTWYITETEIQPHDRTVFDFGFTIGAAFTYRWFRIEGRYTSGLVNNLKDTDFKNLMLQGLIGFHIN